MIAQLHSRRSFLVSSAAAVVVPSVLRGAESKPQKDVAWLGEAQRVPQAIPADAPRLTPLLVDEHGRPINDLTGWQRKREAIRRWWLDFLDYGKLPLERKGTLKFTVLEEDRPEGVVRQRIRYEPEPGLPTEAYLLRPAESDTRPVPPTLRPGAVVLHPTVKNSIYEPAGVEGRAATAFGLQLARWGWVTICPRNFLWSDNRTLDIKKELPRFQARHPGVKGMAKMLFDAVTALDLLAGLPGVDPKRLGAIGHSLGAKEVLYLAAFDPRIQVAVSSEGGIGTTMSNWSDPWYLGDAIRQRGFQHEHHELLALVAPRAFLLLGGDSADGERSWPFISAALPIYRLHGGTPRVGLFNHRKGHSVPPEAESRVYDWMQAYA